MKYIRQENGYTMLLVIFATTLISVIGLGLLTMNSNSLKTSKNENVDQTVYYVAEAGINYYIEEINNLINIAFDEINDEYNSLTDLKEKNEYPFVNNFKMRAKGKINNYIETHQPLQFSDFKSTGELKYAKLQISLIDNTTVNFISTGYIDNKTRTISQTLKIKTDEFSKIKKTVTIGSSGEITPGATSSNYNFLIADTNYPNKTAIYVNKDLDKNKFKDIGVGKISGFNQDKLISKADFDSKFIIPSGIKKVEASENMVIKESMEINNFANSLSRSSSIKIDATNSDITIYIRGDFSPRIPFEVIGENKVNIILINGMNLNEGFELKKRSSAEVNILVKGSANFNTGNGEDVLIQSNIIALDSTFNLNSNKLKIDGNLITYTTSDINVNGSNHSYINGLCAPYAKLNVNGTYNINGGSIVVNELNYNGQASLNYLGNNPPKNACALPSILNNTSTGDYYEYNQPSSLIKLESLIEI